jgi:NDP-sugar pyrophosphorylase family protein
MTIECTAVILAGGRGQRLRPLTDDRPKTLVEVGGKPILHHLINQLEAEGISDIVVCTGYRAEMVTAFLEGHPHVRCVDSGEDAQMMRRLQDATRLGTRQRLLVCYGDTLADVDLGQLVRAHVASGAQATVTVHPLRCPYGVVEFDAQGVVSSVVEKPTLPYWVNIGFCVLELEVAQRAPEHLDLMQTLASMIERRLVHVHAHRGFHVTINNEQDLRDAELAILRRTAR